MSTETSDGTATASDQEGAALAIDDLRVSYGKVAALRGIDLRVERGEIVSVIGPNGAGKTTLAETITGFHDYRGSVRHRGAEVSGRSTSDLVSEGLIHCTEERDLFGHMSVADNLSLGTFRRGDADERRSFVYELFPALEERTDQHARTMSGGEQQMLAIGRALMSAPEFLILDEPTLGLAPVVLDDISDGLERIREAGVTVLLCEQNVTFAMDHADRIALLENGELVREDTPESLRDDDYIRDVYLGG
ncbi:branched chain amino acid ABC transporter ATP-binding protein [Halococcus morrhuae DSM 1307]|uniref:Branched chain amino acid ABC transporter ATP-binding protein n=1 Tax=Halococcus morrhuae DSM 1307 TaxID=931277 RepID=M0MUG6_HALMO|nr:ABC transporter ATP-binding protein [Halococcus morrhuae]EMA48090.1 branched chain amino acid ABC transporter ATP-binding protein [Halococcus morrhuae DSM 1307]